MGVPPECTGSSREVMFCCGGDGEGVLPWGKMGATPLTLGDPGSGLLERHGPSLLNTLRWLTRSKSKAPTPPPKGPEGPTGPGPRFFSDGLISYHSCYHALPATPPATLLLIRASPSSTLALFHWPVPLSGTIFSHMFISPRFQLKCHHLTLSSAAVSRNAPHVISLFRFNFNHSNFQHLTNYLHFWGRMILIECKHHEGNIPRPPPPSAPIPTAVIPTRFIVADKSSGETGRDNGITWTQHGEETHVKWSRRPLGKWGLCTS